MLFFLKLMGPLQLSDRVVQNRQTGDQMTHWDMLNKATKFEFSLFKMAQCVICSPVWRFVPRDCSATKGPKDVQLCVSGKGDNKDPIV